MCLIKQNRFWDFSNLFLFCQQKVTLNPNVVSWNKIAFSNVSRFLRFEIAIFGIPKLSTNMKKSYFLKTFQFFFGGKHVKLGFNVLKLCSKLRFFPEKTRKYTFFKQQFSNKLCNKCWPHFLWTNLSLRGAILYICAHI